jgi:hypothetical protein
MTSKCGKALQNRAIWTHTGDMFVGRRMTMTTMRPPCSLGSLAVVLATASYAPERSSKKSNGKNGDRKKLGLELAKLASDVTWNLGIQRGARDGANGIVGLLGFMIGGPSGIPLLYKDIDMTLPRISP